MSQARCPWAKNELSIRYHDREWGVPVRHDRVLFEFLILEGAQAGLSWDTILKKREAYRTAYCNWDVERVAAFGARDASRLLRAPRAGEESIVRNRLKVAASIGNARAFIEAQQEHGTFAEYIWGFVGGVPIENHRRSMSEVPAVTPEAEAMSKALKKRGFRFVGPTICYAFMQAVGMVNDHLISCPRQAEIRRKHQRTA